MLSEDDFGPKHCQTAAAEDAVSAAVAAAAEHAVAAAAGHAVAAAVAAVAEHAVVAAAVAESHDCAQQLIAKLKQVLQTQHPHHVSPSLVSQQHHAWPDAEGLLA